MNYVNYWLDRLPKILQQTDTSAGDFFGKWYICKVVDPSTYTGNVHNAYYLHNDGIWRGTTYNEDTDSYDGYFDSFEEAEGTLLLLGDLH